jgi:heme-binding protein
LAGDFVPGGARLATLFLIAGLVAAAALLWKPAIVQVAQTTPGKTLEANLHPPQPVSEMLRRSCYDCHSNNTHWPWYAHFRPVANWLNRDVLTGRSALNFSEWSSQTQSNTELQERTLTTSCSLMEAGTMPPSFYLYFHPRAKPSGANVREFCNWARTVTSTMRGQSAE